MKNSAQGANPNVAGKIAFSRHKNLVDFLYAVVVSILKRTQFSIQLHILIGAQGLGRSAASPAISVPRMQLPALPQDEATRILVTRNQFLNRFH